MPSSAPSWFSVEDLNWVVEWSAAQGFEGIAIAVVASDRRHDEVIEIFAPGGIVPRWRIVLIDGAVTCIDHLGRAEVWPGLRAAILAISATLNDSDHAV